MQNVIAPPPRNPPPPTPISSPPEPVAPVALATEAPLLPPILGGSAAFFWLWVLPIAVLLALNWEGYALVEGNMSTAQRAQALWFGGANLANLVVGAALFLLTRSVFLRRASSTANLIARTAPALLVQIGYLWLALASSDVLPRSVTIWIYPESRFLFNQFSFAMLPLFVGILHLACAARSTSAAKAIFVNLGLALGAPILVFLFMHGLRTFQPGVNLPVIAVATTFIVLGITMFVGLVRVLMLALRSAQRHGSATTERAAIVIVALVLPMGGLLLNRNVPFPEDFQAWEVYALTVANAAILLFASWRATRSPRLSFALLCAAFPFSLYFFLVFLPYVPLSVFAVVLFGAGFLILAPTLLLALHLYLLNRARHALRANHGQWSIVMTGVLCFLALPASFVGRAAADKAALNGALQHLYAPAITQGDLVYGSSRTELRRALDSHRSYKNGIYYPLLSDFYSWWVFNHLVLPDDKLARLEQTFFGVAGSNLSLDPTQSQFRNGARRGSSVRAQSGMPRPRQALPRAVQATALTVQTRAAGPADSVVTLALTLHNPGALNDEYVKVLPLPPGVFVNGFRLHIGGQPVPGRIFEQKTALWVYTMIRDSQRQDPGVLFYNTPEELELRVFPIAPRQSTVVEIDFLVPGAVAAADLPTSSRDAAVMLAAMGRRIGPQFAPDARGGFFSVGPEARAGLPVVEREPYLHVIVDRSAAHAYADDLGRGLRRLREAFPAARQARITLANYDVVDLVPELTPLEELTARNFGAWQRRLPPAGSTALDLAIAHGLRRHRDQDLDRAGSREALPGRPIFVILSRDGQVRPLELALTEHWLDLAPEFELYELPADGTLQTHRKSEYAAVPLLRSGGSVRPLHPARPVRFAADLDGTEVGFWSPQARTWQPVEALNRPSDSSAWARAVSLAESQQDYARSPGDAPVDLTGLVRASRESGVLLGSTSYIVVENSAQWRMLERGERQKLSQQAALDFLETPAPPGVWVALAFGGWLFFRNRRGGKAIVNQ